MTRMLTDAERLFNTVVVLGAALVAGCGGSDNHPSDTQTDGGVPDAATIRIDVKGDGGLTDGGWTGW
jgi:hypothetical protein